MAREVERILDAIPHADLALQWDARYEFAMLDGAIAVWFGDVRAGILERLLRLAALVPPEVELGYHLCYGDEEHGHFSEPQDSGNLVAVANALARRARAPAELDPHAGPRGRDDDGGSPRCATCGCRRRPSSTSACCTRPTATRARCGASPPRAATSRGSASRPSAAGAAARRRGEGLLELHRALSAPLPDGTAGRRPAFAWPEGFARIPDEDWTHAPLGESGLAYDHVDEHGWYRNLDHTVEQLARTSTDGDILVDYSGGTGILLDRLRLRIFDRRVGA